MQTMGLTSELIAKKTSGYQWLDIIAPTKAELSDIATRFGLHVALVEDCLQPDHLPKFESVGDNQFVILRTYNESSTDEADSIQEITDKIAVFIGADFILTIHRPVFPFLQQIKTEFVDSGKCPSPYHVLFRIFANVVSSYDRPLAQLIREIDTYEPRIFLQRNTPGLMKDLYYIKRRATVMDNIFELSISIQENLKGKISSIQYNHLKDEFVRLRTSAGQVVDNATNLLNVFISLSTQRTGEVVRILTLFSVFFMPLTFIAGIYGMNFDVMPELRWQYGYLYTILFMVGIAAAIYLWFRRKRWL